MSTPLLEINTDSQETDERNNQEHDMTSSTCSPFNACLHTLSKSLESPESITSHDIVEAYSNLANRLRSACRFEEDDEFKAALPKVLRCLRRDVNEGLMFFPRPIPSSSGSLDSVKFEDHELQLSVDASLLCQSALRVVSLLLSHAGFCASLTGVYSTISIFLSSDIEAAEDWPQLLDPVLQIAEERHLSVFNATKLKAQVLFVLRMPFVLQWIVESPSRVKTSVLCLGTAVNNDSLREHGFKVCPLSAMRYAQMLTILGGSRLCSDQTRLLLRPSQLPLTCNRGRPRLLVRGGGLRALWIG